jgi:hypothetical protein
MMSCCLSTKDINNISNPSVAPFTILKMTFDWNFVWVEHALFIVNVEHDNNLVMSNYYKNGWSLHFKLEVFIWCHVVNLPKTSTTFHRIWICVIFRLREKEESCFMFSIALAWRLVLCLPFPGLPHIYFLFTVRLTNERVEVFLARRSVQHLVWLCWNLFVSSDLIGYYSM